MKLIEAKDEKEAITYLSEIEDYYINNTYMMRYCLVENSLSMLNKIIKLF